MIKITLFDIMNLMTLFERMKFVASGGFNGMMPAIAQLLEQQHRRRVTSEKTSPDGAPWEPNIRGTSILYQTGALAGGFKASSTLFSATLDVPSLPYAHIQNSGGTMLGKPWMAFDVGGDMIFAERSVVPARPYMGISEQNWLQIKQLADRHISRGFSWL